MKIDRHAAVALSVLAIIWIGCIIADITMYLDWQTSLPRYANNWQGMIVLSVGVIVLPVYIGLMLKPPSWLAKWASRP